MVDGSRREMEAHEEARERIVHQMEVRRCRELHPTPNKVRLAVDGHGRTLNAARVAPERRRPVRFLQSAHYRAQYP